MKTETKTTESCRSKRPSYFAEQLLTAELLTAEQEYHRRQQWQFNRSLLGSGILHGFDIEPEKGGDEACMRIGPGLAIDRWGRPIEVGTEGERVCLEQIVCPGDPLPEPGRYTLLIHYAERSWPVPKNSACQPYDQQAGWVCSGACFSLRKGCDKCRPCACPEVECCLDACSYICLRQGSASACVRPDPDPGLVMESPPPLCDRSDGWLWDPESGLDLACVEICETGDQDPCGSERILRLVEPHYCDVRRHVYRNRQLFELIRECHLVRPRVEAPDWLPGWDGVVLPHVGWDEFAGHCNDPNGGFPLWFNRPLRADGLHEASVLLTLSTWERRTDYYEARRVALAEIVRCEISEYKGADFARGVRLKPTSDWLTAEINGTRSTLFDGVLVELTLRGAMLRDHCGTMLDARPPGAAEGPEHNRNGDDLVIAFRVEPRPRAAA